MHFVYQKALILIINTSSLTTKIPLWISQHSFKFEGLFCFQKLSINAVIKDLGDKNTNETKIWYDKFNLYAITAFTGKYYKILT